TIQDTQSARYAETKNSLQQQLEDLGQRIEADSLALQNLDNSPEAQAERNRLETQLNQNRQLYASLLQTFEQVRLAEAESISTVIQADPATIPERPISPKVLQNTLLAAIVGGMLAVGGIFLVEALDDTVKTPDDVTRVTGLPVLGVVAEHDTGKGDLITVSQPRSPVAEAFRSLRTNIQFASVDHPVQTLLVTSALPSEGKSTVAANLAVALAQSGKKVVLLEADLRRPSVHRYLKVPNRLGLSAMFVQTQVYLDGNLQGTRVPNLKVLTAGDLPPNPSELLGSERMYAIIRQVKEQADLLVLDTPPVMAVTDAVVLSPRVDGVLLVVKPGSTKLSALQTAIEQLQRVGAKVLGVVFNGVQLKGYRYRYYSSSYYYYGYHEYYGSEGKKKKKRRPRRVKEGAAPTSQQR
ncbi:MAG: polysaccharide biosynthesis tyrosine autokinase, partial [Anaerolineae bacterium]